MWSYVSYHFSHCYINYHTLCNKKAIKKLKKAKLSWGNTNQHPWPGCQDLIPTIPTTSQFHHLACQRWELVPQKAKERPSRSQKNGTWSRDTRTLRMTHLRTRRARPGRRSFGWSKSQTALLTRVLKTPQAWDMNPALSFMAPGQGSQSTQLRTGCVYTMQLWKTTGSPWDTLHISIHYTNGQAYPTCRAFSASCPGLVHWLSSNHRACRSIRQMWRLTRSVTVLVLMLLAPVSPVPWPQYPPVPPPVTWLGTTLLQLPHWRSCRKISTTTWGTTSQTHRGMTSTYPPPHLCVYPTLTHLMGIVMVQPLMIPHNQWVTTGHPLWSAAGWSGCE